jgi:hypothetical protein
MTNIEIKVSCKSGHYQVRTLIKNCVGEPVLERTHAAANAETAGAMVAAMLLAKEAADEECKQTEHVH